uniref:FHA domain-containing protein n=1 Tax=Leersia perrieri TaxID=77586 RepID=A0A0D9XFD8_9ORYZ
MGEFILRVSSHIVLASKSSPLAPPPPPPTALSQILGASLRNREAHQIWDASTSTLLVPPPTPSDLGLSQEGSRGLGKSVTEGIDLSGRESPSISTMTSAGDNIQAGFAKLQGEDFTYLMQTYSIILGRDSKKGKVDLDIAGGDQNVSCQHARIFYDFTRKRFSLEVLGKLGVEGVLHLPGGHPVKLDSQDLLQIGEKKFYFLLPTRSIFETSANQRFSGSAAFQAGNNGTAANQYDHAASTTARLAHIGTAAPPPHIGIPSQTAQPVRTLAIRSADNNIEDNQKEVLLEEEEYVLRSIGMVIPSLSGRGELVPIEKLHSELVARYSTEWPQRQVQMHLTPEVGSSSGTNSKPWRNLMYLLKKYPERFLVLLSSDEGKVPSYYVTMTSLWGR